MTLDDIKNFYGSGYSFHKKTGWAHTNYTYWEKKGYIPILTQNKIELLTNGALKADYQHGEVLRNADRG